MRAGGLGQMNPSDPPHHTQVVVDVASESGVWIGHCAACTKNLERVINKIHYHSWLPSGEWARLAW